MAKEFIKGLFVKKPHPKAPEFVKMKLSFKVEEFKVYLDQNNNDGWVNIEVKESQKGDLYAELNTWKKDTTPAEECPFG